jgi:hypothetical protein
MESSPSIETLRALARKEWERLKAALELKCHDFLLKKDSNQIELARPGKTITFTFVSTAERLGNEPCLLEVTISRNVTQYLFRLSADKATGHFFERQLLMDLPNHLIHRLPSTTVEKLVASASQYLSR